MRILFFLLLLVCSSFAAFTQNSIHFTVLDSITHSPLPGVNVLMQDTDNGASTDIDGHIVFENIANGTFTFLFSMIGYDERTLLFTFPEAANGEHIILLSEETELLESVTVFSTRTNARIEDEPTRIEVLGLEEMNEESSLVPAGIGGLLGDLAVITLQRTNGFNANDAVRMEGLDARYTQILRDGLPVYGGVSGSLGVLDIPPLDLQQVEVIKGSNSTLYGGGAIAGLINFISRRPTDSTQITVLVNATSVKGMNFSSFTSKKTDAFGITLFTGLNFNSPYTNLSDGFTVIPDEKELIIHPRLFFYPGDKTEINTGLTLTHDNMHAGFADELQDATSKNYTESNSTLRNTIDIQLDHTISASNQFSVKSAFSYFDRTYANQAEGISIYDQNLYDILQYNFYGEANDKIVSGTHTIIAGANLRYSDYDQKSFGLHFQKDADITTGFFGQDDWQITKKFLIEPGARVDITNNYGTFFLPRLAIFYKPAHAVSMRMSAGTGYKTPDNLALSEPVWQLQKIGNTIKSERSVGANADINYTTFIRDKTGIEINQAFYYTKIHDPMRIDSSDIASYIIVNDKSPVESFGSDTYVRLDADPFEFYFGYNHTLAKQHTDSLEIYSPFNPMDKASAVVTFEHNKLRTGIESGYIAHQYLYNNTRVPDYWVFAAMVSWKTNHCLFTLNCENLTNTLQQKQAGWTDLVYGTSVSPEFAPVWAPVEGRVVNFSVKFDL